MAVRITGAGVALTVGIILVAALIVGGLFWARQTADQARRDEAAKIAEQQLEEQSNEEVALNDGEENNDESQANGDEQRDENGSDENIPSTSTNEDEAPVDELPATGPNDAASLLIIALLAFSVSSYIVSRRQLNS